MADDPSQREMLEQLEFGSCDRPGHLGGYDQQPIPCRYGPQLTLSPIEQMANRSEPLNLVVNLESAESNSIHHTCSTSWHAVLLQGPKTIV